MITFAGPITLHFHIGESVADVVSVLHRMEKTMAQSFAEHAVALAAISATVTKIGDETRALLAAVATLTEAVAAAQNVPAEIVAATDALAAQAQVVDDLVPDAPTPGSVIAVG